MKLSYILVVIFLGLNVNAQKTAAGKATAPESAKTAKAETKQKPAVKPGSWLEVCKKDIELYCAKAPDQTSTTTRMCLLENVGKINAQCEKLAFNGMADTALTIARNPECLKDIAKYCPNFAGSKAVTPCLKEHAAQISQDCRNTQETEYKNL